MREIDLTPNWENMAKYMARVLKDDGFESPIAKADFSMQYSDLLVYLSKTDPEAYKRCIKFGNDLADGVKVIIIEEELYDS